MSGTGQNQTVVSGAAVAAQQFNSTKKNFPTLKKITDHKKTYVSPYSFKAIQKP